MSDDENDNIQDNNEMRAEAKDPENLEFAYICQEIDQLRTDEIEDKVSKKDFEDSLSNQEQEDFQEQDSNEHLSTLLNMESINQRENFQSIERLQMKMKEENKKEIMIINENFKRIEESCSNFSNKDINLIMNNYKNMINLNMNKRQDDSAAPAADNKYQEHCSRIDESIVNYSQWFKLNFSNLLKWINTKNMSNCEESEILEFLKDVNENIVDEQKTEIPSVTEKQEKSETQINLEHDDYKTKDDTYNKSYNMDERQRKSYTAKTRGGKPAQHVKQPYNAHKTPSSNYYNSSYNTSQSNYRKPNPSSNQAQQSSNYNHQQGKSRYKEDYMQSGYDDYGQGDNSKHHQGGGGFNNERNQGQAQHMPNQPMVDMLSGMNMQNMNQLGNLQQYGGINPAFNMGFNGLNNFSTLNNFSHLNNQQGNLNNFSQPLGNMSLNQNMNMNLMLNNLQRMNNMQPQAGNNLMMQMNQNNLGAQGQNNQNMQGQGKGNESRNQQGNTGNNTGNSQNNKFNKKK